MLTLMLKPYFDFVTKVEPVLLDLRDHRVLQVSQVYLDLLVRKAYRVLPECKALVVTLVVQDQLERLVLQAALALQVRLDLRVLKVSKVRLVNRVRLVRLDHKVCKVRKGHRDRQGCLVVLEHLEVPGYKALQVSLDSSENALSFSERQICSSRHIK
jgi:hypothetical protein